MGLQVPECVCVCLLAAQSAVTSRQCILCIIVNIENDINERFMTLIKANFQLFDNYERQKPRNWCYCDFACQKWTKHTS